MWSPDLQRWRAFRLAAAFGVAALCGGCFQPLYGSSTVFGSSGESIVGAMRNVQVSVVRTAPGQLRLARVSVEVRNGVIFGLTGGAGEAPPTHRLDIYLSSQQLQVVVDIRSGRPDVQNYGIDAYYTLVDLATGKIVVNGTTFSRVSFNIPGQQQRFAGERGLRDAENRAALVISENIRNRLASYFTAGT